VLRLESGFKKYIQVSIIIHIAFLFLVLFSSPNNRGTYPEGIYRVSLRSIPIPPQKSRDSKVEPEEKIIPLPAPAAEKTKGKTVSEKKEKTATKDKAAKKEKNKTTKTETKKTGAEDGGEILAMLKNVRKELSSTSSGAQSAGASDDIVTGATLSGASKRYYDDVEKRIKDAWVLPESMVLEAKKLRTIIGIKVNRDGNIEKVWTEQSSGNIYYDRTALRAVNKANPLPAMPSEMPDKTLEIGIIF